MDKQLRIIAASIIVESNLSKGAKLQLLNFIKEQATDAQVKALLMDGMVVYLDKQAEEIVEKRWEMSETAKRISKIIVTEVDAVGMAIAGGIVGATLAGAYRMIRASFDKCTRRCGSFEMPTKRRRICMTKCKMDRVQKELEAARKANNKIQIAKKETQLEKMKAKVDKYNETVK